MALADDLRNDLIVFFTPGNDGLGRDLTVQRSTPGDYDPNTGAAGASTTRTYAGVGRVGEYSDYLRVNQAIQDSDRRVTFIPNDITFEPLPADVLFDGVDKYSIVRVKKREANGVMISFTMQVRK